MCTEFRKVSYFVIQPVQLVQGSQVHPLDLQVETLDYDLTWWSWFQGELDFSLKTITIKTYQTRTVFYLNFEGQQYQTSKFKETFTFILYYFQCFTVLTFKNIFALSRKDKICHMANHHMMQCYTFSALLYIFHSSPLLVDHQSDVFIQFRNC